MPHTFPRGRAGSATSVLPVALAALTATLALVTAPLALADPAVASSPDRPTWSPADRTEKVRVLGIADFAGALQDPTGAVGQITDGSGLARPAGGGGYLAATVEQLRTRPASTLLLGAGDLLGGASAADRLLDDRPTVAYLDRLGLDASGVGEQEYARGAEHLSRLITPRCPGESGCPADTPLEPFHGAAFPFLSSNTTSSPTAPPTFPFSVHRVAGVSVGVIAVTETDADLPGTVTVTDPLAGASAAVDELRRLGVRTIIALAHLSPVHDGTTPSECPDALAADAVLRNLPPEIDAVIVGDSGGPATCRMLDPDNDERVVVAPASHGRSVSVIDLSIDLDTGEVVRPQTSAFSQTVHHELAPAPWARQFALDAELAAAPAARRTIGEVSETIPLRGHRDDHRPMADVVADSYLSATRAAGSRLALCDPATVARGLDPGPVDSTDLQRTLPGGEQLVLAEVSGARLRRIVTDLADSDHGTPAVSGNVRITVPGSRTGGPAPGDVTVDGEPVTDEGRYTVTLTESLAATVVAGSPLTPPATRRTARISDIGALAAHVAASSPIPASGPGRVTTTT